MAANEAQSGMYGKCEDQASDLLAQLVDYIRQFYNENADASVREHVRERPGVSLMMAGFAGLITGAILRRG